MTAVPFLDLVAVNSEFRAEADIAWKEVMAHGGYVGGPEVARFESEFAAYCGTSTCIGVANGTDALVVILMGLDVGPGDEVIVPTNTFVATAEAVAAVGARPVFVDVRPDTLLIDPEAVEAAITRDTAAVIAVHLFGQIGDIRRLGEIADRHGIALVEDAAQAHGARSFGRRAGGFGVAAAFSFYPGKNLGAFGDGGAVVTSDEALAAKVRSIANHGRSPSSRDLHVYSGCNSRLDSIQAAVLSAKLNRLDDHNRQRVELMAHYRDALPDGCDPIAVGPDAQPVHHLAVVQVDDRDAVAAALTMAGIAWGIHYAVPCHLQPAFGDWPIDSLPVAERAAGRIISLPMWPGLSTTQVEKVCKILSGVVR